MMDTGSEYRNHGPITVSGVTRVKGQPGQLTNKQGRHMGEDELTP